MRIAILGTGALGCVFAARLAAHADVWMLGTWAEGVAAVRRDGIRVTERDGCVRQVACPGDDRSRRRFPPVDLALLLVKSYQTERAAAWAAQLLRPDGLAVTLQNGLDNGPKLAAAVGAGARGGGRHLQRRDAAGSGRDAARGAVDQHHRHAPAARRSGWTRCAIC